MPLIIKDLLSELSIFLGYIIFTIIVTLIVYILIQYKVLSIEGDFRKTKCLVLFMGLNPKASFSLTIYYLKFLLIIWSVISFTTITTTHYVILVLYILFAFLFSNRDYFSFNMMAYNLLAIFSMIFINIVTDFLFIVRKDAQITALYWIAGLLIITISIQTFLHELLNILKQGAEIYNEKE